MNNYWINVHADVWTNISTKNDGKHGDRNKHASCSKAPNVKLNKIEGWATS